MPAHILLIDDDLALAEMLQAYLPNYGFILSVATTGEEGLRMARESLPDAILLDIHLPDISGLDVAKALQEHPQTAHIPVLFLTEVRGRETKLRGLNLGADDYITKPFDLYELRLRLRNVVESRQRAHHFDPITGLASSALLRTAVQERLQTGVPWALLGMALENFDAFQAKYGTLTANDTLQALAALMRYVMRHHANPSEDLLAHLLPHAFAVLTVPKRVMKLRKAMEETLVPKLHHFYAWEDWMRLPEDQRLHLRFAVLTSDDGDFSSPEIVLQALQHRF